MTTNYHGHCHCKKIKFICKGEPLFTQYCHCNKCRELGLKSENIQDKIGYAHTAAYLTQNFSLISGEDALDEQIRETAKLLLCSSCHSLIYGIALDPARQGGIGINVFNFGFHENIPDSFRPIRHIWYPNRIIDFNDNLPKFKDSPKEQYGSGELVE